MKVLRGNDIIINWSIFIDKGGLKVNANFSNTNLSVFIIDSYGKREAEFEIKNNIISIHYGGETQRLGNVSLDAYWQDETNLTWSRAKKNNVVELVDNPESIDLENTIPDVDIITIGISSDVFFGGTYIANFGNYYTKEEIDNLIIKDYNKLENKPFVYNKTDNSYTTISNIKFGAFVEGKNGSIIRTNGTAEFGSVVIRDRLIVNGKEIIAGGSESGGLDDDLLWLLNCFAYDETNHAIYLKSVPKKGSTSGTSYNLGFYSNSFVAAKGPGENSSSGGGLDEDLLWTILGDGENPNKQINISHLTEALSNYVTLSVLSGYATTKYVDIIKNQLTNSINGLSTTLTNHIENNDIHITKELKDGLVKLISLFDVDENGNVYTKDYSVDGVIKHRGFYSNSFVSAKGISDSGSGSEGLNEELLWAILGNTGDEQISKTHLTNVLNGYVTESWINSKNYATKTELSNYVTTIKFNTEIDRINTEIENKLDASIFNDLFEKVEIEKGIYAIKAKYDFYSIGGVSAKGINSSSGGSTGGIDEEQLWSILGNNGNEQISKTHISSALTGYATENWVESKGYITSHQNIYNLTIKGNDSTVVTFNPKLSSTELIIASGSNISIDVDNINKKITISNTYSYTHPTSTPATITSANGKVLSAITVNNLGHVTSVSAKMLAAGDIPTLSISKISGLQIALDSKLDESVFTDMFEKVVQNGETFIKAKYNFYSVGEVSAKNASSTGGSTASGIDEKQLWAILGNTGTEQISKTHLVDALNGYATENWVLAKNYLTSAALSGYATQSWVVEQGYITSAALEGYATIADVDNRINDLINGAPAAYDTLKEIADVLQGNVDSIGDIITTLGTKADKTITITAGTGLTGGGNLSANRTLSLATVGTAGTYTKVTVDAYGRVTGHSSLVEADIPALSIAKISGLQTALDSKLNASVFNDLFEKVTEDGNTFIKTKYNFYSVGEVAAGGAGTGSGGSGGIDEAQLWSILGNAGTEQISKTHITDALSGYATEEWVTNKGYLTNYTNNYLTGVSGSGNSTVTFTRAGLTALTWNAYHAHAFASLTDKPTTLAGYGITDAVTIGTSQTVTGDKNFTGRLTKDGKNVVLSQGTIGANNLKIPGIGYTYVTEAHGGSTTGGLIYAGVDSTYGFQLNGSNNGNSLFFRGLNNGVFTQWVSVLLHSNYSDILDSRYVTLGTTQTITGAKTFNNTVNIINGNAIKIKNLKSSNATGLFWTNANDGTTNIGGIGMLSSDGVNPSGFYIGWTDSPWNASNSLFINSTSAYYKNNELLHKGNYTTTLDTRYVKKTGDTMTGTLIVPIINLTNISGVKFDGKTYSIVALEGSNSLLGMMENTTYIRSGNTNLYHRKSGSDYIIWDSSNDGTGSGLDADTLDSLHASDLRYISYYNPIKGLLVQTDISSASDTMLNVRITGNSYNAGKVINTYVEAYNYYTGNVIMNARAINYGLNISYINVFNYNGKVCLWIPRYSDYQSYSVYVETTNSSVGNKVANLSDAEMPSTNVTRLIKITPLKAAMTTDNVASATKLATARTIWGQSFDGTANVSGNINDCGGIYLYNVDTSTTPTNPKSGIYQWGNFLQFTARNSNNNYVLSAIDINLSNGNVGIGTGSPSYKLHVNGAIYASNSLIVGTGISVTSGYVTLVSGWFQNNASGVGLYNSAHDARWYANQYGWISDKSATFNGSLSVTSTSTFTGKTTHNGGILSNNVIRCNSLFSAGEYQDDVYGYYNCTRPNSSGSFSCYAMVRNGAFPFSMGFNSSNQIIFGMPNGSKNFTSIWLYVGSTGITTNNITANGNIQAQGEVAAGSTSDARLKNVLTTPDYQKRLLALGNVVDYEYNNKAFQRKSRTIEHRRYTGLIYQNVVSVLPQMAGKDDDGYGYLNYIHTDYINLIAGALQQTIKKQETIEQRVERLERENAELKKQIAKLSA